MRPSWVSRAFDWTLCVVGAVMAVTAIAWLMVSADDVDYHWFLLIPLVTIMGWFPMLIGRVGGGIEIGLDTCLLIFLVFMANDPVEAFVVWFLGTLLCQLLNDKRWQTKAFNVGLGVLSGGITVLVIDLTRGPAENTGRELASMALGAAVYFFVDFVVTAISLSLEEKTSLAAELAPGGAWGAFVVFVAVASLGYLGVIVSRAPPRWAVLLLIVPVATFLVASRAHSRGREHARRLKVLLDTAVDVQTSTDRESLLQVLRVGAGDLLRDPRVEFRSTAPGESEVGVQVRAPGEELWIVGPALNRARSTAADDQQGLAALVAVAEDGFTRLVLAEEISHQAWHDPLTGLANRSLFMDRVQHAMDRQRRGRTRLAVLFCDLDGFKRVNDLYGHAAGDTLLKEVGNRILSAVRVEDTVARLGGDEFAVLIEDVGELGEATMACERILASMRERFQISGEEVSVTITVGLSMSESGASADSLLSQADLAMYHAKSQGKDRHEIYRLSFGDERLQRLELIENLRRAVDTRDLSVEYQPVVDLATNEILGVEALVRWRRDGVMVPPDLFIPTAEESGLIVGLGDLVLEIVTADAPRLLAAAGRTISVGVNVSAQQLQLDGFVERVMSAREQMGPVHLILEVTERDFVHNDPSTVAAMDALAAADVRFAIDDFGVGFSSMSYLQRLPVRILKVDKVFLSNIVDDPRACALVKSMVVLGEAMSLDVVIEGIECSEQLVHLIEHCGAVIGQGFHFASPMTCDELVGLLERTSALPSPGLDPTVETFIGSLPRAVGAP